ncbi:hypothetical protein [Pseudooceanicola sp.]|uniref:hypothetical protein n=1 Tax=Pseudooceanicola sp. TaxID=1914328 RepID=UPI004058D3A3
MATISVIASLPSFKVIVPLAGIISPGIIARAGWWVELTTGSEWAGVQARG